MACWIPHPESSPVQVVLAIVKHLRIAIYVILMAGIDIGVFGKDAQFAAQERKG